MRRAITKLYLKKILAIKYLSLFVLSITILNGSNAFAMDPLGAPYTDLRQWRFNAGLEYFSGSMDIDLINGAWQDYIDGESNSSGDAIDLDLDDFETDKMNVYFGYGLLKNIELFGRIGIASSEFGDTLNHNSESFASDDVPSIGGGIRFTLIDDYYWKIGGVVQANWAQYSGKHNSPLWKSPDFVQIDIKEAQFALGASYLIADGISVYGGPFYHYFSGEFEDTSISYNTSSSVTVTTEYTWDTEVSSTIGGYIGANIDISKSISFNIEYQATGDADGIAAGIVWEF